MYVIYADSTANEAEVLQRYYKESLYKGDMTNVAQLNESAEPAPPNDPGVGKSAVLHIDKTTNTLFYKIIDRPLTPDEQFAQLQEAQKTPDEKYKALDLTTAALDDVKAAKIAQLKELCNNEVYNGFVSTVLGADGTGHEFGFKEKDQANFNSQTNRINLWYNQVTAGTITQAQFDAHFPLSWKAKNHGVVQLTLDEFIQVTNDAAAFLLDRQTKYWTFEAQVNAATTNAEVDAVVW